MKMCLGSSHFIPRCEEFGVPAVVVDPMGKTTAGARETVEVDG